MADRSEQIGQMRDILDAGIKRTRTDRHETEFDLEFLQNRVRELESQETGTKARRPVAATVDLSNF